MASLQKKGESYYCQFMYHGKRHTCTVGAVSEEEAGNKAKQVDYLLMRLKQRLIVLPDGVDIVTFIEHDGKPPSVEGIPITGSRSRWAMPATATCKRFPGAPSRTTACPPSACTCATSSARSAPE
ncbi:MAG TPA: hypothetical protein VH592_02340 [Gemmataceae bacterium]